MQKSTNNPKRNAEGYADPTPYEAIKNMGVEYKAYKLVETLRHVCNLAGFTLDDSTLIIKDRNNTPYTAPDLIARVTHNHGKNKASE